MRILLILLLTASCSASNLKSSVDIRSAQSAADASPSSADAIMKPTEPSAPIQQSPDKSSQDNEQANLPVKVSGTYLYCIPLLSSKTLPDNAYIGCRLNDAAGKKVDPRRLAKSFLYKFESDPDDRIKVVARNSVNSASKYDAFLDLNTDSKISAAAALDKIRVKVELQGLIDGSPDVVVESSIKAVLQPEAESGTNIAWSQSCSNGGCEFRDGITGLYWSAFQIASPYAAANAMCVNSGSAWRMPSANEMYVARANSIANNAYSATIMAQDAYSWTSDLGTLVGGQSNSRIVINAANPNSQFAVYTETISLGYSCVRE